MKTVHELRVHLNNKKNRYYELRDRAIDLNHQVWAEALDKKAVETDTLLSQVRQLEIEMG